MLSSKPLAGLVLSLIVALPAAAQDLAGSPEGGFGRGEAHGWRAGAPHSQGGERECYAQVRYPATYAPPPSGPEYVWREAPAPPGAPGPVWCLTVQPFQSRPAQVAPARLGWIRVLCADDATTERVSRVQRELYERGFYRGDLDGRYDERTARAVVDFQRERHIEHRGYLSYATMSALEGPPPGPPVWRDDRSGLTTFERGYVTWPGKSRYW